MNRGGYAVAGQCNSFSSQSMMFLAEMDSVGNACSLDSTGGIIDSGGVVSTGGIVSSGGIVDSGGIIDSGGIAKIVCSIPNSVNDVVVTNSKVTLYPNPASDIINLKFENINVASIDNIEITNILGCSIRKIQQDKFIEGNPLSLNVSFLNPGMYFIRITTNKRSWEKKFVLY
jgi:hypothetical protein